MRGSERYSNQSPLGNTSVYNLYSNPLTKRSSLLSGESEFIGHTDEPSLLDDGDGATTNLLWVPPRMAHTVFLFQNNAPGDASAVSSCTIFVYPVDDLL